VQTDLNLSQGLSIGTYPVTAFFNINNLFNVTGGYYRGQLLQPRPDLSGALCRPDRALFLHRPAFRPFLKEPCLMRQFFKRGLSAIALMGAVLPGAGHAAPPAPALAAAEPAPPNIILILSDDNSAPHDGCHADADMKRNAITPNFEAFAAQAMCFDRAYDTSPQCAPSRGAIFAGRNPVAIGITRFGEPAGSMCAISPISCAMAAIGRGWKDASTIWAGARAIRRM
jgi:hypothetical protein